MPGAPASRLRVRTLVVVGVLAGFLSGMFGVGGGILIVPGLVLVAGMDQRLAHGTSLAAVLPIATSSFFTYLSHGHIDWPVAAALAAGSMCGTLVGTRLLHVLHHRVLATGFAVLLAVTAARLFIGTSGAGREDFGLVIAAGLFVVGLATGILAGLLGVGGGVVMVPAMSVLFSLPPVLAKGTSTAVMIPTSVMGTLRNRKKKNADIRSAAVVGFSGIAAAVVGGTISDRMDDDLSNVLFAGLLVVVSARMFLEARREGRDG